MNVCLFIYFFRVSDTNFFSFQSHLLCVRLKDGKNATSSPTHSAKMNKLVGSFLDIDRFASTAAVLAQADIYIEISLPCYAICILLLTFSSAQHMRVSECDICNWIFRFVGRVFFCLFSKRRRRRSIERDRCVEAQCALKIYSHRFMVDKYTDTHTHARYVLRTWVMMIAVFHL